MHLFIWHNADLVSETYHANGGLGVIAASLEEARAFLRTPFDRTVHWQQRGEARTTVYHDQRHVPSDCEAFTVDPDVTIELAGAPEPAAWVWPNAGCF